MGNDFEAFYKANLAPHVEAAQQRVITLRKSRRALALGVSAVWGLAAAAGIYALHPSQPLGILIGLSVFAGFGALILFFAIRNTASTAFERDFALQQAERLVQHIPGGQFIPNPKDSFVDYRRAADLGGVNLPGRGQLRYGLNATVADHPIRMVSAKFSSKSEGSNPTEKTSGQEHHQVYFEGLLIEIDLPDGAPTIVIRPRGDRLDKLLGNALPAELYPAPTGRAGFDMLYEVASNRPDEAAKWLNGPFADTFLALPAHLQVDPDHLSAVFQGDTFFMSIYKRARENDIKNNNMLSLLTPRPELKTPYEHRARLAWSEAAIPGRIAMLFGS